jgi:hypothetical protein
MKQVDFDFRSFTLTGGGIEDGTMTRAQMNEFIKQNYPFKEGWQVFSVHVTHTNQTVNVAIAFVKYA